MAKNAKAAKKPKPYKWTKRIIVVLVIYALVGFFAVPAVIKSQMLKRLPALTKRRVAIQQVRCNPFVLSLTIRGFSLKEPNGDVFASFDEFYANFQLWASLFKWGAVFDEISLKQPRWGIWDLRCSIAGRRSKRLIREEYLPKSHKVLICMGLWAMTRLETTIGLGWLMIPMNVPGYFKKLIHWRGL